VYGLKHQKEKRPRYFTAIGLALFAGAIEVAELLVPGRHARLSDFVVDAWLPASVWRLPTCGVERTNPPPIYDRDAHLEYLRNSGLRLALNARTPSFDSSVS